MKCKIAGCVVASFILAGAAVVAIRSLKRLGRILDSITIERDDLMTQ